jgi:hypothetical protein
MVRDAFPQWQSPKYRPHRTQAQLCYMAKLEAFPKGLDTGRIWGIWNEDYLPVRWETVQVSLRDAYRIRRIYRKLATRKGSGSLRRITVFVRHENVVRLLEFLGYCLE